MQNMDEDTNCIWYLYLQSLPFSLVKMRGWFCSFMKAVLDWYNQLH